MPPAPHQLAVSHSAPAASRPRWHAAGCHLRCTECTIPTAPPSAAAATCQFFPFPASGKSNRDLAQENEEPFFLSCATSCPYFCTSNPRTGSALPAQSASTAWQAGKRKECLHVATPSNWQLTQPLACTTLGGSKVLCKHQLINQQQPGGGCGFPGSEAAQAALAQEGCPAMPPSGLCTAATGLALTVMLRNTTCHQCSWQTHTSGLSMSTHPLGGFTQLHWSPGSILCVLQCLLGGVPQHLAAPLGLAVLRDKKLWDPMLDEGDPNSLWRAAPWAPTDDYHGVGGNTRLDTSA